MGQIVPPPLWASQKAWDDYANYHFRLRKIMVFMIIFAALFWTGIIIYLAVANA